MPDSRSNPQHNLQPELAALAAEIRKQERRAHKANKDSLEASFVIGAKLREAKALLPRGKFLAWASEELNYSKQWAAILQRLDRNRDAIQEALAALSDPESINYSIEGALRLIRPPKPPSDGTVSPEGLLHNNKNAREAPMAKLRRELTVAQRRIAQLEAALRANNWEPPPPEPDGSVPPNSAEETQAQALCSRDADLAVDVEADLEEPPESTPAPEPAADEALISREGVTSHRRRATSSKSAESSTPSTTGAPRETEQSGTAERAAKGAAKQPSKRPIRAASRNSKGEVAVR